MNMGTTMRLRAARETDNGFYFTDGESEILLPRSEIPEDWQPGVEADLFVYRDSEDRPTATRRKPEAEVGQSAFLEVVDTGPVGAFVRWGLLKDLLVPHSEQAVPLVVGQKALVLVLLDEETDRLFGTTKLTAHLSRDLSGFRLGQQVQCRVWRLHDQGWTVLVEHRWQGLVYRNQAPAPLTPGEPLQAWIFGPSRVSWRAWSARAAAWGWATSRARPRSRRCWVCRRRPSRPRAERCSRREPSK